MEEKVSSSRSAAAAVGGALGFSLTWGTDHLLVDGHSLTTLPNAWAEMLVAGGLRATPRSRLPLPAPTTRAQRCGRSDSSTAPMRARALLGPFLVGGNEEASFGWPNVVVAVWWSGGDESSGAWGRRDRSWVGAAGKIILLNEKILPGQPQEAEKKRPERHNGRRCSY
uniref:Uncharacterized protein n=1 Tax=Aegilops tauschii TaxID=37682 RepID=M8AHZ4_AEGTA